MQISYHSALTKIQKLQNFKKKKKKLFFCIGQLVRYRPVHGRYFFWYEIGGLYEPVCLSVRYILAIPAGTVRN